MSNVDMSTYKTLFLSSAHDFVENLRRNLKLLNKNPQNKTFSYEVFRCAHSLKGQSLAMGHKTTAALSFLLESIFREIHEGRMSYPSSLYVTLTHTVDQLDSSLQSIQINDKEIDLTESISLLNQALPMKHNS